MTRRSAISSRLSAVLLLAACARAPEARFEAATPVSRVSDVGTAPMFAVSARGDEAVAWISAPGGGTDGRLYVSVGGKTPSVITDSLGPIAAHDEAPPKVAYGPDGALSVAYVVGKVVPGRRFPLGALRFVRSSDGGKSWSAPVTVTDDTTFGSHNFHALHAAGDGTLYVAWLDGRHGKSATYVTRSTDDGRTWAPNVRVSTGESCPCCRTALATGPTGELFLAWRSVYPGSIRDVVVARSTDHGATWSEPVRVHQDDWKFDACPHAGPALQVDGRGRVHVAWWTGKEGSAGVWYARSDDGGRSFGAPIALGVARYSRPAHVQLALGGDTLVVAAWDDGTRAVPRIVVRMSRDGGASFGEAQPVSAADRAAGFPVLGLDARGLTVAWSEEDAAAAERQAKARPNMKDPHAAMGLESVGEAQVMVRRGVVR